MNNELKLLIGLQEMDTVIDGFKAELDRIPAEVEVRRARIREAQQSLEQEKKALQALQVRKKEKENEVLSQEEKVRKNEKELNSVKSNEAYRGLLTEIEAAKNSKSQTEDEILAIMEETDRVNAHLKSLDSQSKETQKQWEAEIQAQEAAGRKVQEEIAGENRKREEFSKQIPKDLLSRYDFIRAKRKAVAIVAIAGDTCSGCNTSLTQSLINEARKGKELVICESCSRILYYPESQGSVPVAP